MAKSNSVDMSAFSSELSGILLQYTKEVSDTTAKWVETSAKKTAKNVKKHAKNAGFELGADGQKYIAGWTADLENGAWIVHNKKMYMLAHLIENGHDILRDGVKVGEAGAFPHIAAAEAELLDMVKDLEKELGGNK